MKITVQILFLITFVYLLNADEDITPEDYSSIELAVPSEDGASKTETNRADEYLKDTNSDEVYEAAKISIQYKDSLHREMMGKEDKKTEEGQIDTDTLERSRILKHKSHINKMGLKEKNKLAKEEDKSTSENRHVNKSNKDGNNEDVRKSSSELVVKSIESDLTKEISDKQISKATVDDMDDLLFTYELEKNKNTYDDDDYDRSRYPEASNADDSEVDGIDDFRPSRRMFNPILILDSKGKSDDHGIYKQQRFGFGATRSSSRLPPILYDRSNFKFPNGPYPSRWAPGMQNNDRKLYGGSREIIMGANKFDNLGEIRNDYIRFGNLPERLNSREMFGSNKFRNAEVNEANILDGFDVRQDMLHNQNRIAQDLHNSPNPNRWDPQQRRGNIPNGWIPHIMMVPNKWIQSPRIRNINGWVRPQTFKIPSGFKPPIIESRFFNSQETYDDFDINDMYPSEYNSLDANTYPHVSEISSNIPEAIINPIHTKLVQATNLPHLQLPIYSVTEYPSYPFDPMIITQRTFAFDPKPRRYSTGDGFEFYRSCCNI